MPASAHEETLLAAAREGDPAALEELLVRYQGLVLRYGLDICRDEQDAQDVAQDTLFAAARGIRGFRQDAALSSWLYTIARSFCIKKRRRGKHEPARVLSLGEDEAEAAWKAADPSPAPDDVLKDRQTLTALRDAIAALSPTLREVFVLRDLEGLPAREVASTLGLTVEAVKSRLHRARETVREGLLARLAG